MKHDPTTDYALCDPDGKVVRYLDLDEVTCMEHFCEVTGYQIKDCKSDAAP